MVSNADIVGGEARLRNVNECGLFRSDDDARVAATSDEDETAALANGLDALAGSRGAGRDRCRRGGAGRHGGVSGG